MRKKRKFCGAPPNGEEWVPSQRFIECDGAEWTIYYSLRCLEDGYVNFKIFSLEPVKSKANYWLGVNQGRVYNRDAPLLELRTELNEWACEVMMGIYSEHAGPVAASALRPVNALRQPAQGQGSLV